MKNLIKVSDIKSMCKIILFFLFLIPHCLSLVLPSESKSCHDVSNYQGVWRLTNYQAIFKCASDTTKDMLAFGILQKETEDCLWLQNLEKCIRNFLKQGTDCTSEIKELIQNNINVS